MIDRSFSARYPSFSDTEFSALQALRARHRVASSHFTERELAHLQFLRWLVHQPLHRRASTRSVHADPKRMLPIGQPPMDDWICRLKAAYDAGYYRTEAAQGCQTPIPRQDGTSASSPLISNSPAAPHSTRVTRRQGRRRWWDVFNRSIAR
ncbi:MAG TPA: hypothetical protein VKX16_03725 [Chloroflexota bacterium]|nr:hypothetical protein [Chloroflexota bacterium]